MRSHAWAWRRSSHGGSGRATASRGRGRLRRRLIDLGAPAVELGGDLFVVAAERLRVGVREADDAHVGVRLPDPWAPEPDLLDRRYDAGEEARPVDAHHLRTVDVAHARLYG